VRVRVLQRALDPRSFFIQRDLQDVPWRPAARVVAGTGAGQRLEVSCYNQVSGRLRLRSAPREPLDERSVIVIGDDDAYEAGDVVFYDGRRAVVTEVGRGEYGPNVTFFVESTKSTIRTTPGLDPRFSPEAPDARR
jgi:hypothetical protein